MMSTKGVGCDIIEIERISNILLKHFDAFLSKILTPKEKEYAKTIKFIETWVAGRFSGKEAVAKSLGTGFGEHLDFHDIEIFNDDKGKPIVYLSEKALKHFGNIKLHLTISHCKSYAVAFCYSEKG